MESAPSLDRPYADMLQAMGLDAGRYPLRRQPMHDGSTHVEELADGRWRSVVTERGRVVESHDHADAGQLLYRLAREIVAQEGSFAQAAAALPGQDPRRADFAHRLELIGRVSPQWRQRLAQELAQTLARHPYRDEPGRDGPGHEAPASGSSCITLRDLIGPAIVAALVLAWVAAHWPLVSAVREQARLERAGQLVSARVEGHERTDGRFADIYWLAYSYDMDGARLSGRDALDWTSWRAAIDGARLDVLVDPADPATSMVRGNDRAGRLWWIYAAIDAMLLFVIGRGIIRARRAAASG